MQRIPGSAPGQSAFLHRHVSSGGLGAPRSKRLPVRGHRRERAPKTVQCRHKFLRFFPNGFYDEKYIAWERGYKWAAHGTWVEELNQTQFQILLDQHKFVEIAQRAVRLESRTNLLFSFEKMALRDAVKTAAGAELFSRGLYDWIYGRGTPQKKFTRWLETISRLPRSQSRVLTWPVVTVFGFIACPDKFIFLKPNVTKRAAVAAGFAFDYRPRPCWETYESLLEFARFLRKDLKDLRPRDLMDIQSFLWVQGSDEYDE